jgi:hypothetical protein
MVEERIIDMNWDLSRNDRLFLVETLMPGYGDPDRAADAISGHEPAIETMLDDERLFRRLIGDEEVLVRVSPRLFFSVLLRRARQDLKKETFTVERRQQQKVVLFDADRVARLLDQEALRDYLAALLASFTHVESITLPVRVKQGVWRRYRVSDLDVESLERFGAAADPAQRFEAYKRIADVCLFLTGMFPDYVNSRPSSVRARASRYRTREDYEAHGQAFYRLASEHDRAQAEGLAGVLATLSDQFVLAEKPLAFLADRYLRFNRYRLFDAARA